MFVCLNNNIVNVGDRWLLLGWNEKVLKLGILDDLVKVRCMVLDFLGFGINVIFGDVLWLDFLFDNGFSYNDFCGIGFFFGFDCI